MLILQKTQKKKFNELSGKATNKQEGNFHLAVLWIFLLGSDKALGYYRELFFCKSNFV